MKTLRNKFQNNGYIKLKNFTTKDQRFKKITYFLNKDLEKAVKKTKINKLGGYLIGNLNVYPGKYGVQVLDVLKKRP